MTKDDFALGDVLKDSITGFKGVAICRTEWLNGCLRVTLQPQDLKDGKPIEAQTFDVEQLDLVKRAKPRDVKPHGGDRAEPARRADPRR